MGAVDERLPTPLYHQIYLVLRNKIVDGEFVLNIDFTPCGHPLAGSCFDANGTPGCDDEACCETVCAASSSISAARGE